TNLSTALKPNITYSGASITPGNLALYDFSDSASNPVVYTVTAADGVTKTDYLVTVTVDTVEPTHGVILSETGESGALTAHDFGTVEHDYSSAPAALSVTVKNTGNRATDGLSVSLSGAELSAFELSTPSLSSIAVGATTTGAFTVAAKPSVTPGAYTETLTVSNGGNGIVESFTVSWTVKPTPVYSITLSNGDDALDGTHGYSFPEAGLPLVYSVPSALSVTVGNTGNQPTGGLSAALSGTNAGCFTVTGAAIAGIGAGGTSANAFSVQPKDSLDVGSYTALVTVSGDNSISMSFNVSFAVVHLSQYASVATGGSWASGFYAIAKDTAGNIYAAGFQNRTTTYTYGPDVSVQGAYGNHNSVIVKYNSAGVAQWAKTTCAGTAGDSYFYGVAVSADGSSVYAVGIQSGNGTFFYGSENLAASVEGRATSSTNAVLVKYSSAGVAQWAQSTAATSSNAASVFNGVAVNGSGVYAAGAQTGTGTFTYGSLSGVTGVANNANSVLVKYDTDGTALWAQSVTGVSGSTFNGVAADGSGVYAAGYQYNGTFDYGNDKTAAGNDMGSNAVIVKYNSDGVAQWAEAAGGGRGGSQFTGVAADALGNVYAAGTQYDAGTVYSGVTSAAAGPDTNAVIVKYNSYGTGVWAQAATGGVSEFRGVAADALGNVYAAGSQGSYYTLNYGGASARGGSGTSAVIVHYNSSVGAALWAKASTGVSNSSYFYGVAADALGNFAAGGWQNQTGTFNYGNDVTATATGGSIAGNAVVVGYK
ncbi:MAG: hypothetical protein LBT01_08160, partial [Spirochaetaceae bacterium]|nr:hypothetical protein [Spirochaetaceae bacterium]